MQSDAQLLEAVPDFLSIESMFKAHPHEDGGRRFIYMEASSEGVDAQNERVLAKALAESTDNFLKFGNIDLDHYSLLGKPNPAKGYPGLPNPEQYEIGRPTAVRLDGDRTFVKAQLFEGSGELARNANMVWDSMTKINPPARWYPSVGGSVLAKSIQIDPKTRNKVAVVEKVRWTNIGLSRTPVNQHLPAAQCVPFGALAKCWAPAGLDLSKAITAGYGTDSAGLVGGAALRKQSLAGVTNYFGFREAMAGAIKGGRVKPISSQGAHAFAVNEFGLSHDEASEYVERFLRDLKSNLKGHRK